MSGSTNKLKPAILINGPYQNDVADCFEYDEKTEIYGACSVSWQNKMHLFGGNIEKKQISRLDDFKLTFLKSLSFEHQSGACSVIRNQIVLCFGTDKHFDLCRQSSGPLKNFTTIARAKNPHYLTPISSSNGTSHSSFKKFENNFQIKYLLLDHTE